MNEPSNRNFSCKDEELSGIATAVAHSLNRDLSDFTSFSSMFTPDYASGYVTLIGSISELLEPASETLAKSLITQHYTATIKGLTKPIAKVSGYLNLAKASLNISDAAFGLSAVRKSIDKNDVEGVISTLRIVIKNINTYKVPLAEKGLTDEFLNSLSDTVLSLADDRQQQIDILSNRRMIVQTNISVFNAVWAQTTEILKIGKVLYKGINPAKLADYTYAQLLKKVRQVSKATSKDTNVTKTTNN